jgi:hypothetical protein
MLGIDQLAALREDGDSFTLLDVALPGGTWIYVLIHDYVLPDGFEPASTTMLLRLPPGFPDAAPDMFWADPPIKVRATGAYPVAADQFELYPVDGEESMQVRRWQRFSRHLPNGAWRPGIDDLRSWLRTIRATLEADVR